MRIMMILIAFLLLVLFVLAALGLSALIFLLSHQESEDEIEEFNDED